MHRYVGAAGRAAIVEDGRTGFLVDDIDQMVRAMLRAGDIDPEERRRVVRDYGSAFRARR